MAVGRRAAVKRAEDIRTDVKTPMKSSDERDGFLPSLFILLRRRCGCIRRKLAQVRMIHFG
jgi:hypothetical protein